MIKLIYYIAITFHNGTLFLQSSRFNNQFNGVTVQGGTRVALYCSGLLCIASKLAILFAQPRNLATDATARFKHVNFSCPSEEVHATVDPSDLTSKNSSCCHTRNRQTTTEWKKLIH